MTFRFASLMNGAEYAYTYDTDAYSSRAEVCERFRMYQTYGDGMVQHSNDWAITKEYFTDYMYSMTAELLRNDELCERVMHRMTSGPRLKAIAFCASIVHKPTEVGGSYESKARYYSVSEQKVSASPAKQHDKRYELVQVRHDGTPEAIYGMLLPEYADGLEKWQYADAIRTWVFDGQSKLYMSLTGNFLNWTGDPETARDMARAFEAARNALEAYRLRCNANSALEALESRRRFAAERAAEAAAPAAADSEESAA